MKKSKVSLNVDSQTGILAFKLPEEREAFELAQKGSSYHCAISDIDNDLFRALIKYGSPKGDYSRDFYEKLTDSDKEMIVDFVEALRKDFHLILESWEVES